MTAIDKAVAWAIETANNNEHGYSQVNRWGNPDYDCASFVISAWEYADVHVRSKGASFTGNMRGAFIACGFVDVTTQVGLATGYGIQAGDVLLNYAAHTCLAVGGGKVANCRTDEGHPQSGDQSGNEIRIQSYWDGSPNRWNCVLRYKGKEQSTTSQVEKPNNSGDNQSNQGNQSTTSQEDHTWKPATLSMSNAYKADCVVLQALLNAHHFPCGSVDGFFGAKTQAAVNAAQKYYGLNVDGVCGPMTWQKLGLDKTILD